MRLFIIDNYDSFTYNIVQYFGELGAEQEVVRNDAIGIDDLKLEEFDGLVISPGPCDPDRAGISLQAIRTMGGKDSSAWGMPGPPVDRTGFRRKNYGGQ
jgi:anthranilate/para-aminobenzoate synthase component II